MKDEFFKKVYIKTEADLPKEEHDYFVQYKNITEERGNEGFVGNKEYWLRFINWYLQSVEEQKSRDRENLIKLVRISRRGSLCWGGITDEMSWKFDIDSENAVIDEYLKNNNQ